ncbi:MAG: hypothetical protein V4674_01320 [Patescibacteria group bacterium]
MNTNRTYRYAQNLLARLDVEFKDGPVGRKVICKDLVREIDSKRRAVASETMSDML